MAENPGALRRRFGRRRAKKRPPEFVEGAPPIEGEEEAAPEGPRRGFYILPNLLTTASLMLGFYSITMSFGQFISPKAGVDYLVRAAWSIFAAAIFDGLDGRVARLTRTTSEFGMQYDSLSDLISFGVAPAVLVYNFSLRWGWKELHGTGLGWVAAVLFVVCGALRLARFNVTTEKLPKGVFQGLAIPGAATALTFTVLLFHDLDWVTRHGVSEAYWLFLAVTVGLSLLMVSKFYYPNFKGVNIHKRRPFGTLLLIAVVLVILFAEPVKCLFLLTMGYALSAPVMWALVYRRTGAYPYARSED
jgi:CDP-diacylglycerol--serine O-phosphatidyltransferase